MLTRHGLRHNRRTDNNHYIPATLAEISMATQTDGFVDSLISSDVGIRSRGLSHTLAAS